MYKCTIILVLRNVSGRPQIVVYHAPSAHISLVAREIFFAKKSHLFHLSSLSRSHRHLSSLQQYNPTTQQPNNKSATTRHNNQQQNDTTTTTTPQQQQKQRNNHNRTTKQHDCRGTQQPHHNNNMTTKPIT